ncbi:MAG: 5-oxoprolinase subunit PxpB, partial [Candidatus Limnocylindrales bacterium]
MIPERARVSALGDAAVLVEVGDAVGIAESRRARALAERLEIRFRGQPGWGNALPAACSVLVAVDPVEPGAEAAVRVIEEAVAELDLEVLGGQPPAGRRIEIPTRYGGPDGPDLDVVAEMTGLSRSAVIEAHAGVEFEALFLGFMPGFAYLGPLPSPLVLPRRSTPRTSVPAGSVAIGGPQTAVYPMASPGGWWLLGRTEAPLWDPRREPPAWILPGDRVRFVPAQDGSRRGPGDVPDTNAPRAGAGDSTSLGAPPAATSEGVDARATGHVFEVLDGGLQTTIQDDGRPGLGALGVPRSGAADRTSLAIANALLGNPPGAAALEATLVGPELLACRDVLVGLAGADLGAATGDLRPLGSGRAHRLVAGARLRLPGPAEGGSRAYLAIAGGFDIPRVLGSSATSLVGGFGGLDGRAIRRGDRLYAGPRPSAEPAL